MTASVAVVGWLVAGTATWLAPPAEPDAAAMAPRAEGEAPPKPAEGKEGEATSPGPGDAGAAPTVEATSPEPAAPDVETDPGGTEATPEGAEAEPAPLPPEGPPPPKPSEPRAWGGAFEAPLPQPPDAADPSALATGPWRGRFWLGVGLAASFPLGGRPPAAGGVISVVGEADLGWRLNRFLGLHTSVSSFAHDAGQRTVSLPDGTALTEIELGRITAFDLVTARVFAPVHPRIEPWGEVGLGVGTRRAPFALERQTVGLVRVGAGVDFWLAPILTLGASVVYRTIILGDAVGHGLRAGADFGIHW